MQNPNAYFAHGHPSQHDAYQWLFAPQGAETQLHALFEFSDIFGDTGGAREDAICPAIGDLFNGFNLHNTVITYVAKHNALLIRRPELLSRGGFLREGILCPSIKNSPVIRYLAALAPKPIINQLEQANRQFSENITKLQNAQPLLKLFAPGAFSLAALSPAIARVIAEFAATSPEKHLCIITPTDNTNLILPLALALDELLPAMHRQRGFVICTNTINSFNSQIAQQLDFSLFPADPRRNIPAPSENIAICDLRLKPAQTPPMVDNIAQLFSQGPQAVAAFAQWTHKRLNNIGWSQLTDQFWQRLTLRSNTELFNLEQVLQNLNSNPLETLDRKSFLTLFHALAAQPQNASARQQIINALKPTIQRHPTTIAWLLEQDILQNKDILPEISQILKNLHRPAT